MSDKVLAEAAGTRAETMQQALEIVAAMKGDKNLAQAVDIMMAGVESAGGEAASAATLPGPPLNTLEIETPFEDEDEQDTQQ